VTIAKDPERQLEPATLEVPPAMIGRPGGVDERAAAAPDVAAIDDEPGVVPARGITFWVRRGAWAFADQALFAASNFLLNVALARMLPPQSYGAFALGYTIFLLLGTVYTSLFVEPLLVFGAGKYRNDLSGYVRELMRFHWRGTMIAGAVLVLAGAVLELLAQRELAATLIALAVASSFILLQWLMRRACYVRFEPRLAAYAGIWYFVFLIAGGYACYRFGVLSPVSAILLMGAGSLISAAMIMVRLRVRPYAPAHDRAHPDVVAEHWEYGRWVIGASLLGWVPQSIY
jgi:O-antigen/teichoic acid export membrane protein